MSCHTSSYASVLAQYAEALTKHTHGPLNATAAAADAAENARLSWAWASYAMDHTGNIHVTPGQGETDTWWTVTVDTLMNTMVLMGAMPEVGTPEDETHIVRASAVLQDVRYSSGGGGGGGGNDGTGRQQQRELVSYDAAEAVSTEKIRVQADALLLPAQLQGKARGGGGGIVVTLDGLPLERVSSALEVSNIAAAANAKAFFAADRGAAAAAEDTSSSQRLDHQEQSAQRRRGVFSLDEATGVVEVARTNGGRVAILTHA